MAKRTDMHRDGAVIPTDYTTLFEYGVFGILGEVEDYGMKELGEAQESGKVNALQTPEGGRSVFQCCFCGAHFSHGMALEHKSGEIVFVGRICAAKIGFAVDQAAWRRRYADAKRRIYLYARRRATFITWKRELLAQAKEVRLAFRSQHRIVRDILSKGLRFGSLSAKQYALVLKIRTEELAPKKPEAAKLPVPTGRVVIEGRVISTRLDDGFRYGTTQLKMLVLVETPEGEFKVWGSAPDALVGQFELKGSRVRFTAACEPKELGFGFFKRPTKPQLLECGPRAGDQALKQLRYDVENTDRALRQTHDARQFTSGLVNSVATELAIRMETEVRARMVTQFGELPTAQAFERFVEEAA